jgi:hypothetical protein
MTETIEPRTHDFGPGCRTWGHDYTINRVRYGGQTIQVSGWGSDGSGDIAEGDYLLLESPDPKRRATRYRVDTIRYAANPSDQWFADLVFAPRRLTPAPSDPGSST